MVVEIPDRFKTNFLACELGNVTITLNNGTKIDVSEDHIIIDGNLLHIKDLKG